MNRIYLKIVLNLVGSFAMICSFNRLYCPVSLQEPEITFSDIRALYAGPPEFYKREAGNLSPDEQCNILFGLFEKNQLSKKPSADDEQEKQLQLQGLQDLSVFALQGSKIPEHRSQSIYEAVKRTNTRYGDVVLMKMLANRLSDMQKLKNRQETVQAFLDEKLGSACDAILQSVKRGQNSAFSAYIKPPQLQENRINELFFSNKFLKKINTKEQALLVSYMSTMARIPMEFLFVPTAVYGLKKIIKNVPTISTELLNRKSTVEKDLEDVQAINQSGIACTSMISAFIKQSKPNAEEFKFFQNSVRMASELVSFATQLCKGTICLIDMVFGKENWLEMAKNGINPWPHIKHCYAFIKSPNRTTALSCIAVPLYIYGLKQTYGKYQDLVKKNETIRFLQKQLMGIATIVRGHNDLMKLAEQDPAMKRLIDEWKQSCAPTTPQFQKLLEMLNTLTFDEKANASYFSHVGRICAAYALYQQTKEQFADIMKLIGIFDAHRSIAKLYKEQSLEKPISPVRFESQQFPHIKVKGYWPLLTSTDHVVTNTLELGNTKAGVIGVTGSNGAGKSRVIEGIGAVAHLAATVTYAPARDIYMTPFNKLYTAIKVSDDPVRGLSHHAAESETAAAMVSRAQNIEENNKVLLLCDELMEGTSPEVGSKSLRDFVEKLVNCPQVLAIIVTQYKGKHGPVALAKKYPQKYANYKVEVVFDKDGLIKERPFKIERGISASTDGDPLLKAAYKKYGVVDINDQSAPELQRSTAAA